MRNKNSLAQGSKFEIWQPFRCLYSGCNANVSMATKRQLCQIISRMASLPIVAKITHPHGIEFCSRIVSQMQTIKASSDFFPPRRLFRQVRRSSYATHECHVKITSRRQTRVQSLWKPLGIVSKSSQTGAMADKPPPRSFACLLHVIYGGRNALMKARSQADAPTGPSS